MQSGCHLQMFKGRILVVAVALCAILLSGLARAVELTDLYQARVPAGLSQAQWQRQALQDVLLKLTGSDEVVRQPGLAESLKNSGQFVVQFQQIQQEGQPYLLVTLDGQKITRLLQSQQIPVWGPRRPVVLLWLTERPVATPQFVINPEHPLRKALLQQGARYGLGLQFPLYDETDTTLVKEETSWGGDWPVLQQASARYQATEVYNLLFDQLTDASGLVQFRLTWQQWVDGAVQSKELLNADALALAQQFCAELAAAQAARYAVRVFAAGDATGDSLQLTFDGVGSLTDLVSLRQLFGNMLTVREHRLVQYTAGQAVLQLQLSASRDEFYRALSLVRELTPQAEPDLTAVAQNTGTTTDAMLAVDQQSTDTGVAASASDTTLLDAEAAMEAALSAPSGQPASVVPVTGDSAPTEALGANSANNPLVISSRYLFRRQ